MPTEVERLAVLIEANTKSYERAIKRVEDKTNKAMRGAARSTRQLDSNVKRLSTSFRTLGGILGAAGIAVTLTQLPRTIRGIISEVSELGKVSSKIGFAVEALQQLRFAGELSGVSFRQTDMALQRFSRRVAEAASGSGVLLPVLTANGVALRDQNGVMRSSVDLLRDYAELIRNAGSESEQLLLAFKAFDSEGAAFVNVLKKGGAGLDTLMGKAREAGGVLGRDLVSKMEMADDALTSLSRNMEINFKSAVATIVAGTIEIENSLTRLGNSDIFKRMNKWFGDMGLMSDLGPGQIRSSTGQIMFPRNFPWEKPGTGMFYRDSLRMGGGGGTGGTGKTIIPPTGGAAEIKQQSDATWELTKRVENLSTAQENLNRITSQFGNEAIDGLYGVLRGTTSLKDAVVRLADSFALAAAKAALLGEGPLASVFGGGTSGGLIGSLLSGFRASGGPVAAGNAYMVGERGRELFVPNTAGKIISNDNIRGMGGGNRTVVNVVNNSGAPVEERRRTEGGANIVDIVVGKVGQRIARGDFDRSLNSRYIMQPRGRQRG